MTIPLAPRTARAIDLAIGERIGGPVFLAADGRRLDRHGAGRIVRRVARRAGITKTVTPHTLRHAFITAALDAGVPLRDVQEAASHADPRTTMRYEGPGAAWTGTPATPRYRWRFPETSGGSIETCRSGRRLWTRPPSRAGRFRHLQLVIHANAEFVIIDYADPEDDPFVYEEGLFGDLYIENPEDIARYRLAFGHAAADLALSPSASLELVTRLCEEKP